MLCVTCNILDLIGPCNNLLTYPECLKLLLEYSGVITYLIYANPVFWSWVLLMCVNPVIGLCGLLKQYILKATYTLLSTAKVFSSYLLQIITKWKRIHVFFKWRFSEKLVNCICSKWLLIKWCHKVWGKTRQV